ncbi:hypothetical protein PVAP13_6NG251300 [Panicum virgatum]|uniref:Reverse transcriptase zinc-binding domain-containing protein n=1 Tax=Panicum virgatum TaxID=38727 RepID=A0A8T0R2M1_PANVG|nr:hypothetical protein PVAP13_6NG251300 [Panicum virgatum]
MLRRKNRGLDDYSCVLCQQNVEETLNHLIFMCTFSSQCWQATGILWDTSLPLGEMVMQARQDFGAMIFREIAIVAAWCIWTHRNSIIFNGQSLSFTRWWQAFIADLSLVLHRAKASVKEELVNWVSSTF